jgi:hypothetical protein
MPHPAGELLVGDVVPGAVGLEPQGRPLGAEAFNGIKEELD